jgi:hypothetical protein
VACAPGAKVRWRGTTARAAPPQWSVANSERYLIGEDQIFRLISHSVLALAKKLEHLQEL